VTRIARVAAPRSAKVRRTKKHPQQALRVLFVCVEAATARRRADDQELAFSTVTARRFCDQQEISLQTATGRSLP
jgi:hypothetical protein